MYYVSFLVGRASVGLARAGLKLTLVRRSIRRKRNEHVFFSSFFLSLSLFFLFEVYIVNFIGDLLSVLIQSSEVQVFFFNE